MYCKRTARTGFGSRLSVILDLSDTTTEMSLHSEKKKDFLKARESELFTSAKTVHISWLAQAVLLLSETIR